MSDFSPTLFVIVGATGDLTRRKLLPSIAHLVSRHGWQDGLHVLGLGRTAQSDGEFRDWARESLEIAGVDSEIISAWCDSSIHYLSTEGGWDAVADKITDIEQANDLPGNRVFYLAIPPGAFPSTIDAIAATGLNEGPGFTRLVVEKPFGHSVESAHELNEHVHAHFDESQTYRIDHYLGKETVQNLLVFRFANALFESSWNRSLVRSVEITVAEDLGLGSRAGYYDTAGALRDMIQNHVTQVLSLVAMEPPVKLEADAIRDEKVKVLRSIQPIRPENVVFGQYESGVVEDEEVAAYRDEKNVADDSTTETAVSLRLHIDNWRWQGVPFYLRTGKRFPERLTQIVVRFNEPPVRLFEVDGACEVHSDAVIITLQPNEGFELLFDVKAPTEEMRLQTVPLDFRYAAAFGKLPGAYETLIEDIVLGDQTLFVRGDEVEAAWKLYQPILDNPPAPEPYAAGTWGPASSTKLPHATGDRWIEETR
ncbi:MAG: glucose-6-phosphate dehydrogenase [Acidimicrobiia bacterium]|nr:glucose-6-phosphate dehydrogenase [Acidimicrobiia bacterium]MBT8216984.1 glucose-6-phosphate dehydrogenase [Acidimicrobiia bacterium]NNL68406.1 glucose-6-phosphate dehydrogenase [Acidimicrobiia bacterium]